MHKEESKFLRELNACQELFTAIQAQEKVPYLNIYIGHPRKKKSDFLCAVKGIYWASDALRPGMTSSSSGQLGMTSLASAQLGMTSSASGQPRTASSASGVLRGGRASAPSARPGIPANLRSFSLHKTRL